MIQEILRPAWSIEKENTKTVRTKRGSRKQNNSLVVLLLGFLLTMSALETTLFVMKKEILGIL